MPHKFFRKSQRVDRERKTLAPEQVRRRRRVSLTIRGVQKKFGAIGGFSLMSQDTLLWLLLIGIAVLLIRVSTITSKLDRAQQQLDAVLSNFNGLREYLYEIDPQFDDERESNKELEDERNLFAPMNDIDLLGRKQAEGRRTLNTRFHEQS